MDCGPRQAQGAGSHRKDAGTRAPAHPGREAHQAPAHTVFRFYHEGIDVRGAASAETWAQEFFPEFSKLVDQLSPMVKHPAFSSEDEYRIVHLLIEDEFSRLQFRQKSTLMARHFPLIFTADSRLPIRHVRVGPSRHKEISRISVDTLLRQRGYPTGLVTTSDVPFQVV